MPHATGVGAANSIAGNDSRGAMDDREHSAMPAWRAGSAADLNERATPRGPSASARTRRLLPTHRGRRPPQVPREPSPSKTIGVSALGRPHSPNTTARFAPRLGIRGQGQREAPVGRPGSGQNHARNAAEFLNSGRCGRRQRSARQGPAARAAAGTVGSSRTARNPGGSRLLRDRSGPM